MGSIWTLALVPASPTYIRDAFVSEYTYMFVKTPLNDNKNELLIFLYITILIYSHYCSHNYTFPLIGMGFGHQLDQTKVGILSITSTMIISEMQNIISRGTRVFRMFAPKMSN